MVSKLKCAYDSRYCNGDPVKYDLIKGGTITLCTAHFNAFRFKERKKGI